jgi:hypothetical protein
MGRAIRGFYGRSSILRISLALSLLCIHVAAAAETSAAAGKPQTVAVTIRQINPGGDTQSVTCTENTKCLLTIALSETNPVRKEDVTVQINFSPGALLLEFQTPRGYLYAGETLPDARDSNYEVIWHADLTSVANLTKNITLYLPLVERPIEAPILNIAAEAAKSAGHPAVATVEVTAQPSP